MLDWRGASIGNRVEVDGWLSVVAVSVGLTKDGHAIRELFDIFARRAACQLRVLRSNSSLEAVKVVQVAHGGKERMRPAHPSTSAQRLHKDSTHLYPMTMRRSRLSSTWNISMTGPDRLSTSARTSWYISTVFGVARSRKAESDTLRISVWPLSFFVAVEGKVQRWTK